MKGLCYTGNVKRFQLSEYLSARKCSKGECRVEKHPAFFTKTMECRQQEADPDHVRPGKPSGEIREDQHERTAARKCRETVSGRLRPVALSVMACLANGQSDRSRKDGRMQPCKPPPCDTGYPAKDNQLSRIFTVQRGRNNRHKDAVKPPPDPG